MMRNSPAAAARLIAALDRATACTLSALRWLALPLALLLFLQWPLRDLVHAWSRQANDLAQCLFALYVAASLTDATRRGGHLAPRSMAPRWAARWRRPLQLAGLLFALLPWSLFVLVSSAAQVWQSVVQLEAFPDSFNPGYFVIKLALWLLAAAVCVQAVIDLCRRDAGTG